jgi:hypothetical protein
MASRWRVYVGGRIGNKCCPTLTRSKWRGNIYCERVAGLLGRSTCECFHIPAAFPRQLILHQSARVKVGSLSRSESALCCGAAAILAAAED